MSRSSRCVSSVVYVIPQVTGGWSGAGSAPASSWRVRHEKKRGGKSPGWGSTASQSIESRFSRAGVPVLKRPSEKPSERSDSERPRAASSPSRPPTSFFSPTCMSAWRKVPVVSSTARACTWVPSPSTTPATWPPSAMTEETSASCTVRFGWVNRTDWTMRA